MRGNSDLRDGEIAIVPTVTDLDDPLRPAVEGRFLHQFAGATVQGGRTDSGRWSGCCSAGSGCSAPTGAGGRSDSGGSGCLRRGLSTHPARSACRGCRGGKYFLHPHLYGCLARPRAGRGYHYAVYRL